MTTLEYQRAEAAQRQQELGRKWQDSLATTDLRPVLLAIGLARTVERSITGGQ